MNEQDKKATPPKNSPPGSYADQEGNDKAPGEDQGKQEKVTPEDLKRKKVDADPNEQEDKPLERP